MISSPKTHDLVVRDYRPAYEWTGKEVQEALADCTEKKDVLGASALFGRLNSEHRAFFGFDFRQRTLDETLPADGRPQLIVLNCLRAAQCYEALRAEQATADAS